MHIEFSNDLLTNSLKASSSSSFCVLGLLGSEESCAFIPRLAASDLADMGVAHPQHCHQRTGWQCLTSHVTGNISVYDNVCCHFMCIFFKSMVSLNKMFIAFHSSTVLSTGRKTK